MQRCHLKRHQAFRRIQVAPRMEGRFDPHQANHSSSVRANTAVVHVHVTRGPNVYATWDVLTFGWLCVQTPASTHGFFPVDLRWSMRHWLVLIHLVLRWRRAHQDWTCSRLIATELSHVAYKLGRFYSFALRVWKTSTSPERIQSREKICNASLVFLFFFFLSRNWTMNSERCILFNFHVATAFTITPTIKRRTTYDWPRCASGVAVSRFCKIFKKLLVGGGGKKKLFRLYYRFSCNFYLYPAYFFLNF